MSLAKRRNRPGSKQSPFDEPILEVEQPPKASKAKPKARKVKPGAKK